IGLCLPFSQERVDKARLPRFDLTHDRDRYRLQPFFTCRVGRRRLSINGAGPHQLAVAFDPDTQPAAVYFDEIRPKPMNVSRIEPDQEIFPEQLPRLRNTNLGSGIAQTGLDGREDSSG